MAATTEYLNKIALHKNEIITRFQANESITKISKSLGFDRNTISTRLEEWGIRVKPKVIDEYSKSEIRSTITSFDLTALEQETKEGCYWLGFILADGSVSSSNNNFELTLAEDDLEHLNKFKDFLKLNIEPKYRDSSSSYRISFGSKRLKDLLSSKGIYPRKSYKTHPIYIPKYPEQFVRGIMDGDGSYTSSVNEPNVLRIKCTGTKPTIDFIKSMFNRGSVYHEAQHQDYTWMFGTSYTVNTISKAPSWLVNHEDYYLSRKVGKINSFAVQRSNSL